MVGIEAFDYCGRHSHAIRHATRSKRYIQRSRVWRHLSHDKHTLHWNHWDVTCFDFSQSQWMNWFEKTAVVMIASNVCLYDAKGHIHISCTHEHSFCVSKFWDTPSSDGLEMWNTFSYILMVTPKPSSTRSPCSKDILKRVGLITYWKFWSSTEGRYLVSGICPSKSSRVNSFCTNSSTFLMSEVLKLSTVFEVARLLSFALLQTLPHVLVRYQGAQVRGVSLRGSLFLELQRSTPLSPSN